MMQGLNKPNPCRGVFRVITVEDYIRVPPSVFNEPIDKIAYEQLRSNYEGKVDRELGVFIAVFDVKVDKRGVIVYGDGATYHKVSFKALVFVPLINEIVEGDVVDVKEYGAHVRIGALTAFIHRSQVMDENVVLFDRQSGVFMGEKNRQKKVGRGDVVRARIVGVSYVSTANGIRLNVSMTMRQPFLGKIEWIEEATKAKKKPQSKPGQ
ncbi:DNA-directed RNA polymerase [Caldivirga maquilingensis]|nr:DNA-directed RNA polymerase [Caldivirga maquilingensis]